MVMNIPAAAPEMLIVIQVPVPNTYPTQTSSNVLVLIYAARGPILSISDCAYANGVTLSDMAKIDQHHASAKPITSLRPSDAYTCMRQ